MGKQAENGEKTEENGGNVGKHGNTQEKREKQGKTGGNREKHWKT